MFLALKTSPASGIVNECNKRRSQASRHGGDMLLMDVDIGQRYQTVRREPDQLTSSDPTIADMRFNVELPSQRPFFNIQAFKDGLT